MRTSKVLVPRAVVEVCSLEWALLEEEDGEVIVAPSTRMRVGAVRSDGRLGEIHSIDDRYDHDVDELMG